MSRLFKRNLSQNEERLVDLVRRLASEYSLSERTIRRYLAAGIDPATRTYRRTAINGKRFYVAPPRSTLFRPLSIARSNIRRAARASVFADGNLAMLREIVAEATELLNRWEGAP